MPQSKNTRTKLQLWNSLYDLVFIQNIEFNQITINTICTNAVVHRSTFYNHFTDKFALYKFGYTYLCQKKNQYSVYQRMFAPFRTASDINHSLHVQFFNTPLLSDTHADFVYELQMDELSAIIDEILPLGYELAISKKLLVDLLLAMHTVLNRHLENGKLTFLEADSIIEKQIKQLVLRVSTSKNVVN